MKKTKKALVTALAVGMLTMGSAYNVMAQPNGYYVGNTEYLSADLATNPSLVQALNAAVAAAGSSNLALNLGGQKAYYSAYIAQLASGVQPGLDSFTTYATAHPYYAPSALTVYNVANPSQPITNNDPPATNSALSVTSVSAINASQVKATFNNAVNATSAVNVANYALQNADGTAAGGVYVGYAELVSTDPNSVILTLANSSSTPTAPATFSDLTKTYKVAVSNDISTSVAAALTTPISGTFVPTDVSLPVLSSVTAVGNSAVDVTFSKPVIISSADFAIKDSTGTTAGGTLTEAYKTGSDFKTVRVSLGTSLPTGTFNLTATGGSSNIKDAEGFLFATATQSFAVTTATTATQVSTITPLSQTQVDVVFTGPVVFTDGTKMTWSSDGITYKSGDSSVVKVSDTEYKVNFTANVLPAGNVTIKVANLLDYNGQTVVTASKSVTVPTNALSTLSGSVAETSDTILTLTFTQPLDNTTATTAGTYVLSSTATTPVVVGGVVPTLDGTKKIVTLTYPAHITPGAYTLAVSGLKDVIGNTVTVANQSLNIAGTTKVDLTSVSATESATTKVIAVTYPVAMSVSGATSITNIANYQYAPDGSLWGNLPAGTSLSATADGKTVNITLPSTSTVSASSLISIGSNTSTAMNLVADSFGNLQAQLPGNSSMAAIGAVGSEVSISADVASTFSTTKIVDAHTLKTLVGGSKIATLAPGDFQYTLNGGTTWTNVTTATLVTDTTGQWVSATIPDTLSASNDVSKIQMRTIASPTSKSALGTAITSSTSSSVVASGTDPFKASIASATMIDATHVRVVFNGFVNASTVGGTGTHIDNGLVITGTDTEATPVVQTITGYDSTPVANKMKAVVDTPNSIIVTFAPSTGQTIDLTKPVTVKTVDPDSTAVASYPLDGNGVALTGNTTGIVAAAVKLQASTAIGGTAIPGTLASQITTSQAITLSFNKLVDPATILTGWDGSSDGAARIKIGTNGLLTVYKSDGTTQYNFGQLPGFAVDKAKNMLGSIALTGTTNSTLTITFLTETGNSVTNNDVTVANGVVRYTPAATLATVGGTPIDTSVTSTVTALSNPLLISASMTTIGGTHKFGTTTGDAIILTYNEPVATSISSTAGATTTSNIASLDSHLAVTGGTYTTTVSGKTVTVTCVTPATSPLDNTTPLTSLVGVATSVIQDTVGPDNSVARNTAITLTNN